MSAFLVDKAHIDVIVGTAARWRVIQVDECDLIGGGLWTENARSVQARYAGLLNDDEDAELGATRYYTWQPRGRVLAPVEMLKALGCLEYQSCEHADWNSSPARRFVDKLRGIAITRLAGYKQADWEIRPASQP